MWKMIFFSRFSFLSISWAQMDIHAGMEEVLRKIPAKDRDKVKSKVLSHRLFTDGSVRGVMEEAERVYSGFFSGGSVEVGRASLQRKAAARLEVG
jgi:hypothetical protein